MIVHCRRPFSLTLARGLRITLFTLIVFSKYSEIGLSVAKELRAPSDRRQIATSYNTTGPFSEVYSSTRILGFDDKQLYIEGREPEAKETKTDCTYEV